MDARINDAPLSNVQQLEVVEERSSSTYNLDVDALNRLIEFGRQNNPRLKGASEARLAELCEVSETTFKSIRKGRNKKPRVDILYSIVALFGGSIDRLIGLAPTRDIRREGAVWDATLADGLQQRIDNLTQQKAEDDAELSRLRKMVLAAEKAQAHAEERCDALRERVIELNADALRHRAELRRHRTTLIVVVVLTLAVFAYIAWEIANPTKGLIQLHYDHMTK